MKFLLDVHISRRLDQALVGHGHDVIHAGISFPTSTDRELLAFAAREARMVVTEDRDFSDLIYAFGVPSPPGVIYIRYLPSEQSNAVDRVLALDFDRVRGHMAVIRRTTTRYRPLPETSKTNG